ncbi:MAG: alpha/beta hydrolase [Rhodobacteraceae bacterium]|nr:alpha/beta hydrolase [Paracoccaceae bacterium]
MPQYFTLPGRNNAELAYCLSTGSSPGVVFLPGLKSDMLGTKALAMEEYCQENQLAMLRFDYLGHGQSSIPFIETTIFDWFESIVGIIEGLKIGPSIIVGSSLGGWLGLVFAHRYPHLVKGFVGIASATEFTEKLIDELTDNQREQLETQGYFESPSEYGEPYVFTRALLHSGKDFRVFNTPFKLECPVRLLHGLDDVDVDPNLSKRILGHVECPDISLKLIPGADHRFSDQRCLEWIKFAVQSIRDTHKISEK